MPHELENVTAQSYRTGSIAQPHRTHRIQALEYAVELYRYAPSSRRLNAATVVEAAVAFEKYLSGER